MKKKKMPVVAIQSAGSIILLMMLAASAASGQYELSRHTIDGAGGTSTGGRSWVIIDYFRYELNRPLETP